MADDIRDFMYTKHNGDYKKIRIFSFIPQRQCKQPNFMKDSIRIFIHAKQPNRNTTRTTKKRHQRGFHYKQKCCYNWDNANSGVFIFKFCNRSANFVHFIYHQFRTLYRSPKFCNWLAEQIRTFHPSLHEFVTGNLLLLWLYNNYALLNTSTCMCT